MNTTLHQRYMVLAVALAGVAMVHFLGPVLTPFIVSMVLAYLGDPLADRLEKAGLSRVISVCMVFLLIFGVIIGTLLFLVPMLIHQIKTVLELLPIWEEWLRTNAIPVVLEYVDFDPLVLDFSELTKQLAGEWQKAGGILANLSVSVTRSSLAFAGFLVNLFLIPVVTFYLLRDWDHMMENLHNMMPRNVERFILVLVRECDEVLGAFLKGQLMVMIALGVIYSLGLAMIGLQFAVLIGMLAGLASIIPYMGFVVGFAAAIIVAFFQFDSYTGMLMVCGVFLAGQALESWFLTPWLVGDKIGLHPVAVIFALMAGGQLFGFVGMLIALPMAAIIMVLLRHLNQNYKASDLYHAGASEKER